MTRARRWLIVGLAVLLLGSLPFLARLLPAERTDRSAADLLAHVKSSTGTPYTGYAESVGGLALPVTGSFSDLSDLFGDTTTMRVWFASRTTWRVDTLSDAGESDLYLDGGSTYLWDYQRSRVQVMPDNPVRLPRSADLLPAELGHRLLSEADPAEVTSLPARRVAGRDAAGLRLTPADDRSTIDRVEAWVDEQSGIPLRVDLYAVGASRPALSTSYLDFSLERPEPAITTFRYPPGVPIDLSRVADLAGYADRFAQPPPRGTLAGLPRRTTQEGLGGVGTYGRGTSVLAAVRLPGRITGPLRDQLSVAPGATTTDDGVAISVGPIGLFVAARGAGRGSWVVSGTVDVATLQQAAAELASSS